jgi:hypothetical protein
MILAACADSIGPRRRILLPNKIKRLHLYNNPSRAEAEHSGEFAHSPGTPTRISHHTHTKRNFECGPPRRIAAFARRDSSRRIIHR